MAPPRPIRIGVVGTGSWGQRLATTLVTLEAFNECRFAGNESWSHWEDILLSGSALKHVDALCIAVPPEFQTKIALRCLQSRIPLLLEKPLALSNDDAQSLVDEASRTRVPVLVDHVHLYSEAYAAIKHWAVEHASEIDRVEFTAGGRVHCYMSALQDWGSHGLAMIYDLCEATGIELSEDLKLTRRCNLDHTCWEKVELQAATRGDVAINMLIASASKPSSPSPINNLSLKIELKNGQWARYDGYDHSVISVVDGGFQVAGAALRPHGMAAGTPLMGAVRALIAQVNRTAPSDDLKSVKLGARVVRALNKLE